jgi:glycosyltransferase involved in cell wall biosynthesis
VSLQAAISQVDVNIVPLQENLFTDSKSELKFFEAGIVRTVTLASPTDIFRRVIENGINGFLSPADSWFDLLEAVNRMDERQHEEMIDRAHQISGARYTGQNAVGDIVSTLATSR